MFKLHSNKFVGKKPFPDFTAHHSLHNSQSSQGSQSSAPSRSCNVFDDAGIENSPSPPSAQSSFLQEAFEDEEFAWFFDLEDEKFVCSRNLSSNCDF